MNVCNDFAARRRMLAPVSVAVFAVMWCGAATSSTVRPAEPLRPVACEQHALASPQQWHTVADAQPVLRWNGDASRAYRVQVAVMLPESRILAGYDVNVAGTEWRLPAPVPGSRAALKVLVSSACPELGAQDLHARGAWFFVDRRGGCELAPDSLRLTATGLAWQPVPDAQRYRVRWWQSGEALPVLLGEREVLEASVAMADAAPQGGAAARAVTVQPVCGGVIGEPAAIGWR